MLTVADIMTREPYTLSPNDSLASARELMAAHHIRHIPIVSPQHTLLGLVSQRDVLAAADSCVLNPPGEPSHESYVALSAIMTSPVQTADEGASLRGAALHLHKNKLGCLPIIKGGKLTGIITDADFVAIAINLMEQLEAAEPDEDDFAPEAYDLD